MSHWNWRVWFTYFREVVKELFRANNNADKSDTNKAEGKSKTKYYNLEEEKIRSNMLFVIISHILFWSQKKVQKKDVF